MERKDKVRCHCIGRPRVPKKYDFCEPIVAFTCSLCIRAFPQKTSEWRKGALNATTK